MKKLLLIALAGLILVAGFWFGRKAYRSHKEQRLITQTEKFMEEKEFAKAALSARQLLQLNANNLTACRVMAFLAEAAGSPHALEWRRRIAEIDPTLDNEIILASCALRFEPAPFSTATKTLQKIADKAAGQASYHVVMSQLSLQLNDRAKAEQHMAEAARLDPKNDSNRLNLAAMRLRSKEAAVAAEARRTLESFRSNETLAAEALRWLVTDAEERSDYSDALKFSAELLEKKEKRDADEFQHLTLLQRSKNSGFAPFLKSMQSNAATNAEAIYKVAAWQIASGAPADALRWVKSLPNTMQTNQPVPVARADALSAMDRWSELIDTLRAEKWGDQEFLRRAFIARGLRMQKEQEASTSNWNRAVEAAEKPDQLAVLTQLAGKWGWEKETEALLWTITEKFEDQAWALESLNQVYEAQRNTAGLLRVFEIKSRRNTADNVMKNNVAMLSLLLKTNVASAHTLAEQVYQADPKNWGFVSTYAYSLHVQGKTADALKLLRELSPNDLERPSLAAYYVILLSAAGEKETARKFVAIAEKAPILPEETRLLQEAKKRL